MADTTTLLTGTLVLGALTYKGIDFVKYLSVAVLGPVDTKGDNDPDRGDGDADVTNRAKAEATNGLISLILGCVVGVGIVFLFALTQMSGQVTIGDLAMSHMSVASKIVFGLALTSFAALLFDGKKALDNTDSASKVKLTLASERARQARTDTAAGVTNRRAGRGGRPKAGVTHAADVEPHDTYDQEVAWMHHEYDTMIDRMYPERTTP